MPYAPSAPCMSDTPPDRDEASAAPNAPRNPWVSWLVWLCLAPVLYVLSSGSVIWLVENHYLPKAATTIYAPFEILSDDLRGRLQEDLHWWFA